MNTEMLTRARRHFFRSYIPLYISRHNARAWARSVRLLGDRWLIAKPIVLNEEKQ